jgi:UDP-glucuronate decarboxylase
MDDPKMRKPDIQIARTQLNWEPSIKLKDGLVSTYQYFSEQLND